MKNRRFYTILMAVLTAVTLIISSTPQNGVAAAPPQQTNLLLNSGFEDYGGGSVAVNWTSWFRNTEKQADCANAYWAQPGWGGATDFKNSGTYSQFIGNSWDTWMGGVYQDVSVTPGSTYKFSFKAYGYAGAGGDESSDPGVNLQVRAAVDTSGTANWGNATAGASGSPHQVWQEFSVEFTATGDKVTVFTIADTAVNGVNQCRAKLNTFYDDAQLIEVGSPPTNTPPPPAQPAATNTPVPPTATAVPDVPDVPPTETAVSTPEPSATPTGGSVCLNAFADTNGNGVHDADEGYMAGVTFSVANAERVVGQGVSAGAEQPVCFDGLNAGEYQATQILPPRLEMTTAAQAMITVNDGGVVGIEFGSRVRTEQEIATVVTEIQKTAVSPVDNGDNDSNTPITAYLGLAAIGIVILALIGIIIKTLKK